ncbi:ACT domain-containing protein [Ensifer adhaerens]|uniref:ACT domain-containing protein n=1 Tax=Ensifer adhaerens TaxID=106592 RepID=UPI001C4DFEC4|nr:ACT domain-containing protein [Ensifer adhaerens]MBW0366481.1 ACT domain-containing protein [Ensifer adhaerens]UCM18567.1 ACT domain-containing protein [Ensifer adhaerens]
MAGETDLAKLLSTMNPVLFPQTYVYCTVAYQDQARYQALEALATYREDEGLTLVVTRAAADEAGLAYGPLLRRITLNVHSALEAVGLTAAVSTALTREGISANVIAAYYHDHIFVPEADAERALDALRALTVA